MTRTNGQYLKKCQFGLSGQLSLLVLCGIRMDQMLKEPRPKDGCGFTG